MPNWERLEELYDLIVKENHLHMATWFSDRVGATPTLRVNFDVDDSGNTVMRDWCGSSCCIAGHAILRYSDYRIQQEDGTWMLDVNDSEAFDEAQHLLELTYIEADDLFARTLLEERFYVDDVLHKVRKPENWEPAYAGTEWPEDRALRYLRACLDERRMMPLHEFYRAHPEVARLERL